MTTRLFSKLLSGVLLVSAMSLQFGCAAMSNRDLQTNVQMQQTIFIDPDKLDDRPVYVRVTNQTGKSDMNFEALVIQKLNAKGIKTTKNPKIAGLRLLANFLYLDKAKEGMTSQGALAGGVGGALVGGASTRTYTGAGIGGLAGAGIGALAGSFVHVDTWYGIVDIQIEEPLSKTVTRRVSSGSDQSSRSVSANSHRNSTGSGGSAYASTSGNRNSSGLDYTEETNHDRKSTRIVAEAKQTNINVSEATTAIREQLSDAISNFM